MLLYLEPHLPNLPVISTAAAVDGSAHTARVLSQFSPQDFFQSRISPSLGAIQSRREGELISPEQPSTNT